MKQLFSFFIGSILFLGVYSCAGKQSDKSTKADSRTTSSIDYATGFSIYYSDNYKQVIVHNPWDEGKIYANYYLVEDKNTATPADGIKVQIPLKSLAATSVTHFEFLGLLDELNSITGVCQPYLIYNSYLRNKIEENQLADLGDAFQINVEKTLMLKPDAIMMSGLNQVDANAQRISQAGIPVIYNNEWTENTLLGRAEWIKFVASFYNKEALANSIFGEIENRYNDIKEKANQIAHKPSIMTGSNFRGTWYMPTGNSFMGQLFADGGASYFYSADESTGSLPLNFETVLVNFSDTDYWLNCNFNSIDELIKADSRHQLFRPVKSGQVYNFNKRMLPSGANDFWESAIARPDLLLADVIAILHPEILPDYELFYAEKLK